MSIKLSILNETMLQCLIGRKQPGINTYFVLNVPFIKYFVCLSVCIFNFGNQCLNTNLPFRSVSLRLRNSRTLKI